MNEKNNIKIPGSIVMTIIMTLVIIIGMYFIIKILSPVEIVPYSGYAISGKQLTENLLNESYEEDDEKTPKIVKVEEQDMIFKRLNNYYLGIDGNPSVNIEYPLFINDKIALYNISEKNTLISDKFEESDTYPRFILVEGSIYNEGDLERADQNNYIFIKNQENIFINQYAIKIKTQYNSYEIPKNSIIHFRENSISYYMIQQEKLVFKKIQDIDLASIIQIKEKEYTYEKLLANLNLKEEKLQVEEVVIKEEPEELETKEEVDEEEPEEVEEEPIEENEEIIEDEEEPEEKYIKPEVKCTDFEANVYSAKTTINIKDPSRKIKTPVTFEFRKNGKIYLRKAVISSGQLEIIGLEPSQKYNIIATYTFLNEEGQKVQKEILNQDIETKGIETLEPIELSFQNGELFSKKIQVKDMQIVSSLTSEALKGIKRFELQIGNSSYKVSNSKINQMLRGEAIIQETAENLPSNTTINYTFKIYDLKGNELKIINASGTTKTAKIKPKVSVKIKKQDISEVELMLTLKNDDHVQMQNYKYVLFDANGEKIKEDTLQENQQSLFLYDLDPNRYYDLHLYSDYDLEDGKGFVVNDELGNCNFISYPLSKLGYLYIKTEIANITKDSATLSITINKDKTDSRLTYILQDIKISIYSEKDNEDSLIQTKTITGEELEKIKGTENTEILFDGLDSKTTYYIKQNCRVKQGNTEETIKTVGTLESFTTNKKPAEVLVKNQFVTESMIDFDVKIDDSDEAVLINKVRMELRDDKYKLIKMESIETNTDFIRLNYTKLEEKTNYTIKFYADEYNEGNTDATYKNNYLLKTIEIYTEPGISGSIGLIDLQRTEQGKNLIDVNSEVKWYSNVFNINYLNMYYDKTYNKKTGELRLFAGKNGYGQYYVYDLRKYAGQTVTISFKAKKDEYSENMAVYLQNSKTGSNRTMINGITEDEWLDCRYTVNVDSSGYLGFYIKSANSIYEQYLILKELQVELGSRKTAYKPYEYEIDGSFKINLQDKREEIVGKDYYVKIIENGNDKNLEHYIEIDENGRVQDAIKTYIFDEAKEYEVQLIVTVRDRMYIISSTDFSTKGEIQGISTVDEYLQIQPYGNYIVLQDLDMTEKSGASCRFGNSQFGIRGKIDFQGHTVSVAYKDQEGLFYNIERTGTIENLVFDVYLNNTMESSWFRGLVTTNYGTIRNLMVNLKQCNELGNISFGLMGNSNYGTVENFIIDFEVPLYGARAVTGGFINNYGIMRNGYIYGEDIQATFTVGVGQARDSASLVYINEKGTIQNVYSLVHVISAEQEGVTERSASVVCRNYRGIVRNIYSVGKGSSPDLKYGPTVGTNESGRVYNAYYFCDGICNNTYNIKTTKLALHDTQFQNIMLNSRNEFIVNDLIEQKYYPQLKMSSKMPNQEFIPLPEVEDKDLVDILSCDLIEDNTTSVKVQLSINNPSGERIKDVKAKEISSRILSQQYEDGRTTMMVELYNPVHYKSQYSIMSITAQGAFNGAYTREYEEGERTIFVDLYRPVENIEDWKEINDAPTENYRLMTDLDFNNCEKEIIITNAYTGKLDGANHTIKNIKIPQNQGNYGLIYRTSGEIKNLNIENYSKDNPTSNTYLAFIAICDTNAIIDNVHLKNISLSSSIVNSTNYTGGIVATASNTIIRNTSITGLKVNISGDINNVRIGGILGNGDNVTIENCYAQDLDIKANGALIYYGIGGIIGRDSNDIVRYCYSTGNINTDAEYVGGIIGYGGGKVESCYSTVNIRSETDFIAGIIGYDTNTGTGNITRNLYLGDIYTSKLSTLVNRIQGNVTTDVENYAYASSKINGYVETDELGAEKLLTYSEIFDLNTYKSMLAFEDEFNYSGLEQGILPKLYNMDGVTILPNQKDQKIGAKEIYIKEVDSEKADVVTAKVRVVINNPAGIEITGVNIEYANVTMDACVFDERYGETYVDLTVKAERAYDSYIINQIVCNDAGQEIIVQTEGRIKIQFYKEINSYEDWQKIDDYSAQNYRLNTDIDFEGKIDPKINVSIGRLEADSSGHTLKNLEFTVSGTSKGFIKILKNSIKNVTFENITVHNTANSGNYSGLIVRNVGTIENVNFKNITVDAPKIGYIGMIGYNSTINIKNVKLEDITVSGKEHVGGFMGLSDSGNFQNITIDTANITATSTYSGSVIGRVASRVPYQIVGITADDVHVNGVDRVGGIIGEGRGAEFTVTNSEISGRDYIGGIFGVLNHHSTDNRRLVCIDSTITGTRNYAGGIVGSSGQIYAGFSVGNTINGVNYVGGIGGNTSNEIRESGVKGCTIVATGNDAGGISGYLSGTVYYSYAYSTSVEGKQNVGGIAGEYRSGWLAYTYNNCTVKATQDSAGAIVGYLNNQYMTGANYVSRIFHNATYGTNVTAPTYVGGVAGKDIEPLYHSNFFYNNYIDAYLTCDTEFVSMGIGTGKEQNNTISKFYVYENSTINGDSIRNTTDVIPNNNFITRVELSSSSTYTSKVGLSSSYFNFTRLSEGIYPLIHVSNVIIDYQDGVPFPPEVPITPQTTGTLGALRGVIDEKVEENEEIEEENAEEESKIEEEKEEVKEEENVEESEKELEGQTEEKVQKDSKELLRKGNKTEETEDVSDNLQEETEEKIETDKELDGVVFLEEPIDQDKIVDSYNGNEYETILNEEGKLEDLKSPIIYPENFVNKNIEKITTENTEEPQVTVEYESGRIITFDYTTGNMVYDNGVKEEISLFDYIKNSLSLDKVKENINEQSEEQTSQSNTSISYNGVNRKSIMKTSGMKWIAPTIIAILISLTVLIKINRNKKK